MKRLESFSGCCKITRELENKIAVQTLLQAQRSSERKLITRYMIIADKMIVEIIKALQNDPSINADICCEIELKYLQQLYDYGA